MFRILWDHFSKIRFSYQFLCSTCQRCSEKCFFDSLICCSDSKKYFFRKTFKNIFCACFSFSRSCDRDDWCCKKCFISLFKKTRKKLTCCIFAKFCHIFVAYFQSCQRWNTFFSLFFIFDHQNGSWSSFFASKNARLQWWKPQKSDQN